jgi:hypothetical protein
MVGSRLGAVALPVELPIGAEDEFEGRGRPDRNEGHHLGWHASAQVATVR